jgi:hypothetical protein
VAGGRQILDAAELVTLGYSVESGKTRSEKISRPVLFGENGPVPLTPPDFSRTGGLSRAAHGSGDGQARLQPAGEAPRILRR